MPKYIGILNDALTVTAQVAGQKCLFVDPSGRQCCRPPIKSHSLQRNGPLSSIAEDAHVIKIGFALTANLQSEKNVFAKTSIAQASTFPGFCEDHDASLFQEIERKDGAVDLRAANLLAIRAIARELHAKRHFVELQTQAAKSFGVEPQNRGGQVAKLMAKGAKLAERENLTKLKSLLKNHQQRPQPNFKYVSFRYDREAFFASTGAFEPIQDFSGAKILFKKSPTAKSNSVYIFAGNIFGYFHLIACCTQIFPHHRVDKYLRSLLLTGEMSLEDVFFLCVDNIENTFVRQSWFNSIPEPLKEHIKKRAFSLNVSSTTKSVMRQSDMFRNVASLSAVTHNLDQ